jgi:predicted dienelactone hydrolase
VPRGNHLAYLPPCTRAMLIARRVVCNDAPGFDRAAFNVEFNAAIVRFFRAQFGLAP